MPDLPDAVADAAMRLAQTVDVYVLRMDCETAYMAPVELRKHRQRIWRTYGIWVDHPYLDDGRSKAAQGVTLWIDDDQRADLEALRATLPGFLADESSRTV